MDAKILLTVFLLGLGVVACQAPKSGVPAIGPLSAEQRSRLDATADALADATQFKAKAMNVEHLEGPSAPTAEKRDQVLKAIDENCQIGPEAVAAPSPQPKTSVVKMRVASKAKKSETPCPIDFSWETTTTNNLDDKAGVISGRIDTVFHYAPAGDDAKGAFRAQSYDFTNTVASTVQGATVTYKGSGMGTAKVFINGSVQNVSLSSSTTGQISGEASNFTYSYNVVYRDGLFVDLKLVLKQAGAGQPMTMNCTLNGVAMDQKEFLPYLAKLGFETRLPSQLKN